MGWTPSPPPSPHPPQRHYEIKYSKINLEMSPNYEENIALTAEL